MPLCDLIIIHGGQGSVQSAIAACVPMIGIPLQPEQFFNVRQVERHGAGRCLSLRELKKGKLRAAIQDVLGDPRYRTAMGKLQGFQAARNGPCEVARVIPQLVA
jgi:UDP:flavonoid glycosyltransferase YjiC (YdhE family)